MPAASPASRAALGRVLVSADQIAARMPTLADEVVRWLGEGDDEVVIIPVMTGAFIFAADLVRQLPMRMRITLATVSSYPGAATTSQGVRPVGNLPARLDGRRVLIVDDILDSGGTLRLLRSEFMARGAADVRACVLLRKRIPSALGTPCEYVGFDIDDEFVVGYGLDYDDLYRNLPYVGTLRKDALSR